MIDRVFHRLGRGSVDQRPLEVLGLEHLTEFFDAPVLDQELQPCLGAQPTVAVVAEHGGDAFPDVGHLVERNPGADPLGQHRIRRQSAADPEIKAGTVLGMVDPDECDVVDLVRYVLQARDRGLELARQIGEFRIADVAADNLVDRPARVEHLVERFARQRRAQHDAGAVAAGLGGLQPDRGQPLPDLGDVLDADPVVLHVLAVADVGRVAGELGGDLAEGPQRGSRQCPAVAADPHHEVLGLEDVGVLVAGPGAVVALLALGVETHPAHPAAQILLVDAVEALLGVDVEDARPHVERVVVLLELLVRVERLAVAERPLPLAARALDGLCGCHWGLAPSWSRRSDALFTGGLSGGADPAAS